jgi:hypothetical protein
MKRINICYWIFTGLFAAFMGLTAIPDIIMSDDVMVFMRLLGYPDYFVPFIGWAKVLGSIAILIPGFPRIKEWAYAGLFFDLIGAIYSVIAVGQSAGAVFILLPMIIGVLSYIFYHKKIKTSAIR